MLATIDVSDLSLLTQRVFLRCITVKSVFSDYAQFCHPPAELLRLSEAELFSIEPPSDLEIAVLIELNAA